MEVNLSNTWIAIKLGKSEYCINSDYVLGISELSKAEYKSPVNYSNLIKGIYKVFQANIYVLDGRRLLGYTSIDEEKLNFSNFIHSIKHKHLTWVDELEWAVVTKDSFNRSLIPENTELGIWIDSVEFKDEKLNDILKKIRDPLKVICSLSKKALESQSNLNYSDSHNLVKEIKRQSEKYISKYLDNMIEIHNKELTEMCIIIRCKGVDFGISADNLVAISEQSGEISKQCNDRLSAGTVKIKDKEYNIINLTKITNLVKNQEVKK